MDHTGQWTTEKQGQIGHVFRGGEPPHRGSLPGRAQDLLPVGKFLQRLGINRTRTDCIDQNTFGSQLDRQMPDQ